MEKILDGPNVGYCSDSESDDDKFASNPLTHPNTSLTNGASSTGPRTGPKGVLHDYDMHRKLAREEEKERNCKILKYANRFSIETPNQDALAEQNDELEDIREKRLQQLKRMAGGKVVEIANKFKFLSIIEETPGYSVLIHIYNEETEDSTALNNALLEMGSIFKKCKFYKVKATLLGTSLQFNRGALPALQIYRNSILVGNFIRITEHLGHDFSIKDLLDFLEQ